MQEVKRKRCCKLIESSQIIIIIPETTQTKKLKRNVFFSPINPQTNPLSKQPAENAREEYRAF